VSVYASQSNEGVTSGGILKFFHVPLMFPIINAEEKNWIWIPKAENYTQIVISLATSNDEFTKLVHDFIMNDSTKKNYKVNIAPLVINSLTAIIVSAIGDPISGIHPVHFINPNHISLKFRFQCSSADKAQAAMNQILDGNYNMELSIHYTGLYTLSMNMIKITGKTLKTIISSTTADGGNTSARYIHRTQASKFVSNYMANVKKTIYIENPTADAQLMIAGLEDQFKTLIQLGKVLLNLFVM
jgi:hypothetical protein